MKGKILIIEDDKKLNDGIKLALRGEYCCEQVFSIKEAKELYHADHFDVILLDVNLPDGSGFDFMEEIRKTDLIPIILLTANKMEMDIVSGLEMGANDYITKPFSLAVLRARVAVQLRNKVMKSFLFSVGDFRFDFHRMEFLKKDNVLELSKTEQRLLRKLVENMGRSITREQLIDYVWQGENEFVDEHALTVVVNRLRNKLGGDDQNYIKTVYGIGYMWVGK
ncbi:response regulator transcription factor [Extibacter muris]|uniref:Stage 0 sporulation protein A homolog n=1 Tax=Extibacter muris TaxID=1796622 RepID=A0A4R4FCA4_9FIRM|nr:response regulator transcription factor [Extibacter muris]MCU0079111.1 response regulator transcription factor [Extibacter muris]TDA20911.1 response regulator transcription factor [Extibacter muris]